MATAQSTQTTPMPDTTVVAARETSYVDWGVIIAGAIAAAALFLLFTTFGSAVGLSVATPWSGPSARSLGVMAAIWFLLVQVGSFAAGGYLAGRMRRRSTLASVDETEFRDGAHGFLVWCVGFLVSAIMLMTTTAAVVQTGLQAGGAAAGAVASQATGGDPLGYAVDAMMRGTQPGATSQQNADPRAEVTRVIGAAVARGELTAADRTYLAQLVAQHTGISPQEAEQRVTQTVNQARDAADRARKVAAVTGFLIAASLVVSAAAAWLASQAGGRHRDQGTITAWLRRRSPVR
jgi:hypothetical protein